jgi:hypothetical protein
LLTEVGLTRDAIRAALDGEWEQSLAVAGVSVVAQLPEATSDPHRSPWIGASTKLLLKRAADHASATGGGVAGLFQRLSVIIGWMWTVALAVRVRSRLRSPVVVG